MAITVKYLSESESNIDNHPATRNLFISLGTDTDLKAFVQLYERFGIDLKIRETDINRYEKEGFCIKIKESGNVKFTGYEGFYSVIYFDKQGKFIEQGFWE